MDKRLSRRGVIKKSAVALGTIAVCDLTAIVGTEREDAFKVLASKGLKENNMPHVMVQDFGLGDRNRPNRGLQKPSSKMLSILSDAVKNR